MVGEGFTRGKRAVAAVAVGTVLLLAGGLTMWEFWPEATVTSGDCERAVECPPMTIESGSAAWTMLGALLLLAGLALIAVAVLRSSSSRVRRRPVSAPREQPSTGGGAVS
jgi:divalent metal cation (Fe/Co/Zn/Cd) transporter